MLSTREIQFLDKKKILLASKMLSILTFNSAVSRNISFTPNFHCPIEFARINGNNLKPLFKFIYFYRCLQTTHVNGYLNSCSLFCR